MNKRKRKGDIVRYRSCKWRRGTRIYERKGKEKKKEWEKCKKESEGNVKEIELQNREKDDS